MSFIRWMANADRAKGLVQSIGEIGHYRYPYGWLWYEPKKVTHKTKLALRCKSKVQRVVLCQRFRYKGLYWVEHTVSFTTSTCVNRRLWFLAHREHVYTIHEYWIKGYSVQAFEWLVLVQVGDCKSYALKNQYPTVYDTGGDSMNIERGVVSDTMGTWVSDTHRNMVISIGYWIWHKMSKGYFGNFPLSDIG